MRPIIFAAMLLAFVARAADQPGLVKSEFIFETAPFPECHASTIVETKDGSLLAAWFGGKEEKDPSVGIWTSANKSGKWSPPVEVANGNQPDGKRLPCWNPVLFQPSSGPLLLFYKVGPTPARWWGMLIASTDNGATWSAPRKLGDGIIGPVKNKPIQLANGDLLAGSSTEHDGWRVHFEKVHFEKSGDLGQTWQIIGPIHDGKKIRAIQPSILQHKDGRLQAIGRTGSNKVFTTESKDNGATWSEMTLLDLPNPNAGADAITLKDGRHLLVYNHSGKGREWDFGRQILNVALSDDGKNWGAALLLEKEKSGEFSYPAVIQTKDGLVHITYTWRREKIRHIVVDPAQLKTRPIQGERWPE